MSSSAPSGGSKLKVNIKGTTLTKVGKSNKQHTSDMNLLETREVDLLGGNESLESACPSMEASAPDNFNGFFTSAHVQPQGMLDSSNNKPVAPNTQQFVADFMNQGLTHSTPHQFFQSHPHSIQTQLPMHPSNEFHSLNSVPFEAFSQSTQSHHQVFPQQMQPPSQFQQSSTVFQAKLTDDTDFGSFESATATNSQKSVPENKYASFGGLVDLGGLTSKTIDEAKKQQSVMAQPSAMGNSFSGLDGFAKSSMGTMNMISMQNSIPSHTMTHGGPVMMNNQLMYGQQQLNQLQINQQQTQSQSFNVLSGQHPGVSPQGNSMVRNNMLQQHMMHQPGQFVQQGMTVQQQHSNIGGYYQQPGHGSKSTMNSML
jgi:hypothetical protein